MLILCLPVTTAYLDLAVLTGYDKRGLDFNPRAMTDPSLTATSVSYGWVLGTRSNACPSCLQERGIWPTRWRLLWSVTCRHHQKGLIESCPDCASPLMALRRRLRVVPGATHCHCGLNLGLADSMTPSSTLLRTQKVLDDAMNGQAVTLAGDLLTPQAFFVVFRTLADLIRTSGYDLDGNQWASPQSLQDDRINALSLASVQAIVERAGRILALPTQESVAAVSELRDRAARQSVQVRWRFRKYGLDPSRTGRIGRILSSRTPDL